MHSPNTPPRRVSGLRRLDPLGVSPRLPPSRGCRWLPLFPPTHRSPVHQRGLPKSPFLSPVTCQAQAISLASADNFVHLRGSSPPDGPLKMGQVWLSASVEGAEHGKECSSHPTIEKKPEKSNQPVMSPEFQSMMPCRGDPGGPRVAEPGRKWWPPGNQVRRKRLKSQ